MSVFLLARKTDTQETSTTEMVMHRVVQQFVIGKLQGFGGYETPALEATRVAFQNAIDVIAREMPLTAGIRASSKEDLVRLRWCLAHAQSLAGRYAKLHLRPRLDWIGLFLDCAGCAARLGEWCVTRELTAMANSMLESVVGAGYGELEEDSVGELRRRGEVMFLDDWGF